MSPFRHPVAILALGLAVLPYLVTGVGLTYSTATSIAIFALVGLGLNLLLGYTGLVSFGHGAFFGAAAYTTALTQIHLFGNGLVLPLVAAVLVAAAMGVAMGALILRRRGVYFSLLTLAFTAMIFYVVFRWTSLTGGENGLGGISRPSLLGLDLDDPLAFYYLTASLVLASAAFAWRVVRSPVGRVLVAIRENEQRTLFLGYPVRRYKLIGFVLSATLTGLAGGLFALLNRFVSADLVHVQFSGEILAMSVIGGMGHFLGPALGALFFILFREVLSEVTSAWQLYFGLLFIVFVLFSPSGLMGIGARLAAPFRRHRADLAAMAARANPVPAAEVPRFLRRTDRPPAGSTLLEAKGITRRFGDFTAVSGVDFAVPAATLKTLIGPNGAGKTTLFNVLSGMYPPDAGSLRMAGRRIDGLPADAFVRLGVARSFQIINLFQGLTVRENVRLAVQQRDPRRLDILAPADGLASVNAETDAVLRFVGLVGLEEAQTSSLSYGGQRLLEIGVALASRPRALLLDEPLAGLAAAERERVAGLVKALASEMAVVLVEHDIDRAFALSDRVTAMHNGRVLVDGSPAAVRESREVQEVYLGSGRAGEASRHAGRRPERAGTALALREVNTFYGKSHVLHDITLEVGDREVIAILGRNGAGKSSALKTITGLSPPRSGSVRFEGEEIAGRPPEVIARRGIALVPQGRRLFPNLTVGENLAIGRLERSSGDGVTWDLERVVATFPKLASLMRSRAGVLSGGEQQMVAIARALSGRVRLLLLDEPFEGLGPAVREEVFEVVDRLRREIGVVVVEHDLDLVLALADRVYVLDQGRVSHEGPAAPLLADLELRRRVLWL